MNSALIGESGGTLTKSDTKHLYITNSQEGQTLRHTGQFVFPKYGDDNSSAREI
jgi:hypothetical protein